MVDGNSGEVSAKSALKGMISFFTLWHMDIDQNNMDSMERKFHLVPIVGMIFGIIILIELSVFALLMRWFGFGSALVWAIAILLTVYIGSKFLHFDGLTDFGDGMIVSGQQEDHVRALKDTLVGAGGIGVALAVVLTSFSVYSMAGIVALILLAPMTEIFLKNAMVFAAAYGIPGKGMAGRQVEMTGTDSVVRSLVVSLICSVVMVLLSDLVLYLLTDARASLIIYGIILALVGLAVSSLAGYVMARVSNRTFGMVNGDILGATNEIARPAVMFFMYLVLCIMAVI